MAGPCLADTSCIHLTFDPVTGTMSATPVVPGAGPGGGGNGVACTPTGLVAEKIDSPTVTWSGGPGQLIAAINQAGISAGLTPSGALCNEITNPGDGLYSENDFMLQGRMAGMSTQDDAQPSTLQSLDPYAGAALIPPTPLGGFVARPSGTNWLYTVEFAITNPSTCAPMQVMFTVDFGSAQISQVASPPTTRAISTQCGVTVNGILRDSFQTNYRSNAAPGGPPNSQGIAHGSLSFNTLIAAGVTQTIGGFKLVGDSPGFTGFDGLQSMGRLRVTYIGGTAR